MQGRILQSIGGFYHVESAGAVYLCRGCGLLRKNNITPVAGDLVVIDAQSDGTGTVRQVLPRRNVLQRPPLANIDVQLIVASVEDPAPDLFLLDKMIAIAEDQGIDPIVVFTKADLGDTAQWEQIYRSVGLPVFAVSSMNPQSAAPLSAFLQGKICAFTGNTGVGKSSLLNLIDPSFARSTGETSQKLGRGRHTTRSAVLLPFAGGYVVDTPGFSALEVEDQLEADRLADCFREFEPMIGTCRFRTCTHVHEPGCTVRSALESGEILPSRYQSYVALYTALSQKKRWEK